DHPAEEPAGPVYTDEPHRLGEALAFLVGLARNRDDRADLRAERPLKLFALPAGLGDLRDNLLPDLRPQPGGLGGGERLDLQRGPAVDDRHPDDPILVLLPRDVDLHFDVRANGDAQRPQVDPPCFGYLLRDVPRPLGSVLVVLLDGLSHRSRPGRDGGGDDVVNAALGLLLASASEHAATPLP